MIIAVLASVLPALAALAWAGGSGGHRLANLPPVVRDTAAADGPRGNETGAGPAVAPGLPASALVELTATQLDAGLALAEAVAILAHSHAGHAYPQLRRVGAALRLGLDWDTAWAGLGDAPRVLRDYRDALEFTATSAAASASVLRGQAQQVRRAQYRRAERAAEALSVRLVLPLGLCCLPAFMCWGVLPVLMSLLPRVFGS